MVGSIVLTHDPDKSSRSVAKGDEHGYFAFGGSTIVLLFRTGSIVWDSDLLEHSRLGTETIVQMGESIGRVSSPSPAPSHTAATAATTNDSKQ